MAQVRRKSFDDLSAPTLALLPLQNRPSDLPVEMDELTIHSERGLQTRRTNSHLELGEQFRVSYGSYQFTRHPGLHELINHIFRSAASCSSAVLIPCLPVYPTVYLLTASMTLLAHNCV